LLRSCIDNHDVVWLKANFVAAWIALPFLCGSKTYRVSHQVGDPAKIAVGPSLLLPPIRLLAAAMTCLVHRVADVNVFVSRQLADHYGRKSCEPWICNESRLRPDQIVDPSSLPQDLHQPIRLLYVGRLSPEKGIPILLRAATKLACDYELRLAGSGQQEVELKSLASALGVQHKVHFLGPISWGDALFDLMRSSDILILPSHTEGLGLVLLEAMSQGLPVVASDVGGIPEVVRDGVTGLLFPAGDADALAAAISKLVNHDRLRIEVRKNALEVARDNTIDRQLCKMFVRLFARLDAAKEPGQGIFSPAASHNEALESGPAAGGTPNAAPVHRGAVEPLGMRTGIAVTLTAGLPSIAEMDAAEATTEPRVRPRILAICTLDVMAWKLLLPWFRALREAGYEVHIACARTNWFERLAADGFHMHDVPLRRRMNPLVHIRPLWALHRLIRRERFALVNTHSPVAAAVGRVAAWFARTPVVVYTVHGFYFHDDMPWWKRRGFIALEWLLGRMTDDFMFVSDEDRQTALRDGIARDAAKATTIFNGVDLEAYAPSGATPEAADKVRRELNIPEGAPVVGIVGRVVREKGYFEFAEMAKLLSCGCGDVYFLVVGDALPSDRDGIAAALRNRVNAAGLRDRFRFTGFTDHVADYLQAMDIFVLPSYREGFPRSVLEAMSTGLPVIATNIRGCREAVVQGETGLLVPPRDGKALAAAVSRLLRDPDLALSMGAAGRRRAVRLYGQRLVESRFVEVVKGALRAKTLEKRPAEFRRMQSVFEWIISAAVLLVLAPLLGAIAAAICIAMGSNPIFAQSRIGVKGRTFTFYKFRTMSDVRDKTGKLLPDRQRITALGRWLRGTSLDELPQLWNVLKGDMGLVGPRPLLPEYLHRYSALQRRRHEVKPGITGWAQVNGRNGLTWEQKFESDVWYVDHWSLWLDVKILWMTALQVLRPEGIGHAGHATMPEFLGSPTKSRRDE
jgi:glycosyltransferase involved in cell wall biosynthesis